MKINKNIENLESLRFEAYASNKYLFKKILYKYWYGRIKYYSI